MFSVLPIPNFLCKCQVLTPIEMYFLKCINLTIVIRSGDYYVHRLAFCYPGVKWKQVM